MQLEIYYNSTLLKTTLKSQITIKEIIQNAKSKLNTQKNFLIFNNEFEILSEDEKITPIEKTTFQLFLIEF